MYNYTHILRYSLWYLVSVNQVLPMVIVERQCSFLKNCKKVFVIYFHLFLLIKKEGNVTASGYRNAKGYEHVSLFDLGFTWLFF